MRVWSARTRYTSHLTLSVSGEVLVATDTSGGLRGIDAESGEDRWETAGTGEEGDAPISLVDGTLLAVSWGARVFRIDIATGATIDEQVMFDVFMAKNLDRSISGDLVVFARNSPPPSDSEPPPPARLYRLDATGYKWRELPVARRFADYALCPDGSCTAVGWRDLSQGTGTAVIELIELATGDTLAIRALEEPYRPRDSARWSPDGELLSVPTRSGHLFLDGRSLDLHAFVPDGRSQRPAWSPDGRLVCLCSDDRATLARRRALSDAYRLPG